MLTSDESLTLHIFTALSYKPRFRTPITRPICLQLTKCFREVYLARLFLHADPDWFQLTISLLITAAQPLRLIDRLKYSTSSTGGLAGFLDLTLSKFSSRHTATAAACSHPIRKSTSERTADSLIFSF
ncbi:hypothetical protein VTL71DRAFT_12601 [Oculimacula yallundae]|uniref:Uncharacterized protein n=1 Tax=Oculimacula yallundae TaxID=86028 RepID=A0ABR4CMZ1_9HELO